MRRAVAAVAIVIILILVVLGVHSCQISARNSSLKNYAANVASVIQQSNATGAQLFRQLSSANAGSPSSLRSQIDETRVKADSQLKAAEGFDVPDEVKPAQQNLLLTLQMRRDGIANIALNIEQALAKTTNKDAINTIAAEMARFYASDVVYKDYTAPLIVSALNAVGINTGGVNGVTIEGGQFFPDLSWLNPSTVASRLGSTLPSSSSAKIAPGLHGHSLDSVSVSGTTLQTGSTNTVPASPAPTFTLNFTNGGQNTETNIMCKVTVSGSSVSGTATVAQTTAGEHATCQVPLSSSPPTGTATVSATVVPVPGEKNIANNTLTFPVTFQ